MRNLMPLKTKILLLAVVPLVATLALIAVSVLHQEQDLARRERLLVENAYMKSKEAELRHYVALALSALQPIYRTGRDDEQAKQEALRLLESMDYGSDGYFFLYEQNGKNIMHPRQPELVGTNLWEMRDPNGLLVIQELIAKSKEAGGGFVRYQWRKPSTRQIAPKLGYVVSLDRWNWMFGSGLYLDDIETTLAQLDREVKSNINATLLLMAGIAAFGVALIGACGVILNLSEHRIAHSKLQRLAHQVVQSQEDERAHLSRDLHDGTSQTLASIGLMLESAIDQLEREPESGLPVVLTTALARLHDASAEVRRISHRLRPTLLDTLGLPAALRHLGEEFCQHSGMMFSMTHDGEPVDLPEDVKTVFFRVAQEALTNIEKHADAARIDMHLSFESRELQLTVRDDGRGFETESVRQHPRKGIGLRNMRERLDSIGGRWSVTSKPGCTEVCAQVPVNAAIFNEAIRA